jgi:hypothetical protein
MFAKWRQPGELECFLFITKIVRVKSCRFYEFSYVGRKKLQFKKLFIKTFLFTKASAGRNAFQLSNGALYSERDCSGTTFSRDDVDDTRNTNADDLNDYTTSKTTSTGGFKPKAKPQVSLKLSTA